MNSLVLLLALAGPGVNVPSVNDLFDPLSNKFPTSQGRLQSKQASFQRLLAQKGPATMLKAMAKCEPAVKELRKYRAGVYKRYLKTHDKYFGWMEKYRTNYMRKQKREPIEYPMPDSLEKAYIAAEISIKSANAIVLSEMRFHGWALDRLAASPMDDKLHAAAAAGVGQKNAYQALRCIRILRNDPSLLDSLVAKNKIVEAAIQDAAKHLWAKEREVLGEWVAAVATGSGVQRDNLNDLLTRVNGKAEKDWTAWFEALPDGWQPVLRMPRAGATNPDVVVPIPSPSGRAFFGVPTGSERFILCVPVNATAVLREVERFLASAPETATFVLVGFGKGANVFRKKASSNNASNRAAALKWLASDRIKAGMDTFTGLDRALDFASEADTLIVVSPGRPTIRDRSGALVCNPRQIGYEIEYRNRGLGLRVLAVGQSSGAESYFLQQIARPHRGGFRSVGR